MHEPPWAGEAVLEMADTLGDGFDLIDHLTKLSTHVRDVLDADGAGVLLIDESSGLRIVASSDERSHLLELFELQNRQGPCIDCAGTGVPVLNESLDPPGRWCDFATEARQAGFRLTHAFPMARGDELLGAVNVFASDPTPVDTERLSIARSLVSAATLGLLQLRARTDIELVNGQLEQALRSRVTIEQAKGMLVGRHDVDVDAAFEAMRRYARANSTKIAEVAACIISGTLDEPTLFR